MECQLSACELSPDKLFLEESPPDQQQELGDKERQELMEESCRQFPPLDELSADGDEARVENENLCNHEKEGEECNEKVTAGQNSSSDITSPKPGTTQYMSSYRTPLLVSQKCQCIFIV